MRPAAIICLLTLLPSTLHADELEMQARTTLAKTTTAFRSISTHGGYLWRYTPDLKQRWGESVATATQIWVQPPGTPEVGMAFLRAYEVTKDAQYLAAARDAASALVFGQLESGGWDYRIDFDVDAKTKWYRRADVGKVDPARRRNNTVLDDDNTQSAIRFLLKFVELTKDSREQRDQAARDALDYALAGLLKAQYPNGAFPQVYMGQPRNPAEHPLRRAVMPADPAALPKVKEYWFFYTFNDHCTRRCVTTLLEAHQKTARAEYLDAAKRCGDFILHAQLPEPQPVWAQQYDLEMRPAWARKFEPPSVCSSESAGIIRTLIDLHLATGEQKFLTPIPAALKWFDRSRIGVEKWARFYELGSNRPLYFTKDYQLVYRDDDLPTHYSFQGDYGVAEATDYYQQVMELGREGYLRKQARPRKRNPDVLGPRAQVAIDALDPEGFWITGGEIRSATFIRNIEILCDYLDAAR
jgi:hypothetical protein